MKTVFEGSSPFTRVASIAASGTADVGLLNCRNLANILLTGRVTYNASATGAVTLNAYYSPDGQNFDTIVLDSKALTITAGSAVQASKLLTVPDSGWLKITASNADAEYAATSLVIWATVVYQFFEDRQTTANT